MILAIALVASLRILEAMAESTGTLVDKFKILLAVDRCLFLLQRLEEFREYYRFGLWWVALAVASSIGLARLSGREVDAVEELDSDDRGIMAAQLNKIKRWFLSHAQYLNFLTILVLASVSMDVLLHFQHELMIMIHCNHINELGFGFKILLGNGDSGNNGCHCFFCVRIAVTCWAYKGETFFSELQRIDGQVQSSGKRQSLLLQNAREG
ncbi:unnamed protein product [Lupinus luteus]|uniref:Uncharacterized protein n=1 Tax=Lupinus luteus TaxID=3873 RepID=A0AAV1XFI6_LUPLU